MDFSTLPPELQFKYLLNLSPNLILKYCETNQTAQSICQDPFFWDQKSILDLGVPISLLDNLTPYQKYRFIQGLGTAPALYGLLVRSNRFDLTEKFFHRTIQERDLGDLITVLIDTDDLLALKTLAPTLADYLRESIKYALFVGSERAAEYLNSLDPTYLQDLSFLDELLEAGISVTPYLQILIDKYGKQQLLSVAVDENLIHIQPLLA